MQPYKHKKINNKFIFNNLTGSQSFSKSVKILTKLRIFQNCKEPDQLYILLQTAINKLNIAEFFTQDTKL